MIDALVLALLRLHSGCVEAVRLVAVYVEPVYVEAVLHKLC